MRRLLLALILVIGVVHPVTAATSLEGLIQSATGIQRTVDPALQASAAQRVDQIQVTFEHCCLAVGEAEVIGWNIGYADPLAAVVGGWMGSPTHAVILNDPDYTRIGCAWEFGAQDRNWFACRLVATTLNTIPNTALEKP